MFFLHRPSGFDPHIPQTPPSFCEEGSLLLHVLANLPPFLSNILTAKPKKARDSNRIDKSMIFDNGDILDNGNLKFVLENRN
ncbi:MAG: hypothetical protein ABII90_07840 [Bacteroidota bacterium]